MKIAKIVFLTFIFFLVQSCKKSTAEFNSDPALFKEYISGYTSGIVPVSSDIRVVLAFDKSEWKTNQVLDSDLFDISPSVSGKVIALSANTVSFVPNKKLKNGTQYQVKFNLAKLLKVDDNLKEFKFTVTTLKQDFTVNTLDIQSHSRDLQYLNVLVKSADELSAESAAKLISAKQNGDKLKVIFKKELSSDTQFHFVIDNIKRGTSNSTIEINYDGNAIDVDQKGTIDYDIVARDNFEVVKVEVVDGESQTLQINFTDPIEKMQDFSGLLAIESAYNLTYSVAGNILKVFLEKPLTGSLLTEVFQGIQSSDGKKLQQTYSEKIDFSPLVPGVRFMKSGTLLPESANLKLNFEAVNLNAVDVKVYKIFKNNILQFLQDNDLNGSQNLKRVAQPIAKQKLVLNRGNLADMSKWTSFALDLSNMITPEPGAVYRVEFSFKKSYSSYPCKSSEAEEPDNERDEIDENDVNYSSDNYYDDYYYEENYEWRESQDPCKNSYYYNTSVATNVLSTNLGVIAKRGDNKSYFFAVNNILNTDPVSGAKVEIYSFQQQKIAEKSTDDDGTVAFNLDKFAYFAIVTKDKHTTYVKLDDGTSLSVSNFDVSGEQLQKGLKGYIYGERGVWRPGDNIYLSFVLDDRANKLPESHPIKLTVTDPRGKQRYQNVVKSNSLNHYSFVVPTDQSAPTGNWEAMISVGGAHFYKSVKVETIKPNRLKIKNSFSGKTLSSTGNNIANVNVMWLHGAIAKNLKIDVKAKFSQQKTTFKNYDKYVFDDATRNFSTEEINIYSGRVDENGNAQFSISPKLNAQAPGMLKASFITKVYEDGGDFSTDVISTTYSPFQTYIGLKTAETNKYGMLETRKVNKFEIVSVDENGRPKPRTEVSVKVYKVNWRWWWDASDENLSDYNSSNSTTEFKSYTLTTDASGRTSVSFKLSDDEWGRYLIRVSDVNGGHATSQTVLVDWPSWSGKVREGDASNANMLVFTTDKKEYAVGEKARITFPSSKGSRALISIENGSRVVQTFWVKTLDGESTVSIPITASMAPNVYFNITLLQPHVNSQNDSPIRMYGIVPIAVVDKNTILKPQIAMPEVLKPEQPYTVKVSEASGRAMTYTIAVVDDGLLDLTRFKTPNAWDAFYVKEALGVKTWDVYDDIIGAYGGKVNQIFSIGGDQDLGGGNAKKANRFKPVVVFLGPFSLKKGETKSHQITLPKYVGSVRTMVVAADASASAYGSVEKTTPVRSPLMILASLPRKISPSEKVTVPVTVFAMENQVKNVTLQIKTSKGLRIVGPTTQSLTFSSPDEKMAYFDLEVGGTTGIAKVEIIATSGKEKASYEVEIDMTNPTPVTNIYQDIILEPNATNSISWETFGVAGSNTAQLEISSSPTIDINRRLEYLISYPHGCLEQVTSGIFAQLYLNDVADITASRKESVQRNVTAGINIVSGMQLSNGGFAYWPGQNYADDWGTSYVGHFMLEAEKKGYALPAQMKTKWSSYQQKEARLWRFQPQYGNDLAQAYRLYTLALAGNPDMSSMNRLRETVGISNQSKLRLAAAYAVAGQKSAAMALFSKTPLDSETNGYYYYGSEARNQAMTLETLILLGQTQRSFEVAIKLAKELASSDWMSTQTTAYSLYAMTRFITSKGKGIDVNYSNGTKSENGKTNKAILNRPLVVKSGANSVTLKNNKNSTLFVRVLNSGILPVGQEEMVQSNLSASVYYKDRDGNRISVESIRQGTEMVAEITISNLQNESVQNLALTQILPSGFEIVNTRFTDYGDSKNNADYIDIRDDRANFYFSLKANESRTFTVLLNASYLGRYYLPGTQCEAMYDRSYIVRTQGQWIEVIR